MRLTSGISHSNFDQRHIPYLKTTCGPKPTTQLLLNPYHRHPVLITYDV